MIKRIFAVLVLVCVLLSGCKAETVGTDYDFSKVMEDTMATIINDAPNPGHSSINGEWSIIVAARRGEEVPEGWYDVYYNNICATLEENEGVLSNTKHSDYSRAVLALSAIGKDPTDVAGYNLFETYADFDVVTKQGIPGSIFALISLDCLGYELSDWGNSSREKFIEYILSEEYEGGGWALMGEDPDIDITAQVIQSFAPYYGKNEEVTAAVDRAVAVLSGLQNDEGGFSAWGGENVQSAAQVGIALSSIGINIRTDERFIKENGWIGSYVMKYYLGDGAFCHTLNMAKDSKATDQCMQMFVAMELLEKGENRFYDFTDIK